MPRLRTPPSTVQISGLIFCNPATLLPYYLAAVITVHLDAMRGMQPCQAVPTPIGRVGFTVSSLRRAFGKSDRPRNGSQIADQLLLVRFNLLRT
jgi:hypothetical protein